MRARVLFRDAQGRSGEVDLSSAEPCYIGRALDCAVRTDDAMVSRKHSLIRGEAGRFVIEDLGSSNGTHVNDIKVQRQALNHNDVVRCGNLWLRYVEEADRVAPTPAESPVPAEAAASQSGPSKFRSTLGGGSQPPGTPPAATPAVSAPASSPSASAPPAPAPAPAPAAPAPAAPAPSAPAPARARALPATEAPPEASSDDGSASASPFESTQDGTGPGAAAGRSPAAAMPARPAEPPRDPTPPPAAIEIGGGNRVPVRPQSPDVTPIGMSRHRATTGPTAEELERKLRIAVSRAEELERGLRTLQGELSTAQEKIRTLLSVVQEIASIEVE